MRKVSPIRKELGIRTIFNILGPLTNPARPSHMLVGVGAFELGEIFAQVLSRQVAIMFKDMHKRRDLTLT